MAVARSGTPRSPVWAKAFLAALAQNGNVGLACKAAKIGRRTAYNWREADKAFAEAWLDALEEAADTLEAEAWRRARDGVDEPVIYQGELSGVWVDRRGNIVDEDDDAQQIPLTVKKYSDSLLQFLLRGCRPAKFRDATEVEHKGGVEVQIVHRVIRAKPPDGESGN